MNRKVEVSIRQLALSLALVGIVQGDALGQRLSSRFYVTPPDSAALGQQLTLGVRLTTAGTTYRYAATMRVTGAWRDAASVGCTAPQTIGSGNRVNWTPASGTYRITVYGSMRTAANGLTGTKGGDSASVSYVVTAPSGGWLNIVVTQLPNPSPPGNLTLTLSTNDRGAGYAYEWRARLKSVTTSHVTDYSGASPGPTISVPLILTPGHYNVTARVGAHRGNACQITQVSDGLLNGQVVR